MDTERKVDVDLQRTLAKVLSLAHVGKRRAPRWVHVGAITSHGSTVSASLCCHFGLDPDEVVGGKDPVTWSALSCLGASA